MSKARAGRWWNFCHIPFTRICQPRNIRVNLHLVRKSTDSVVLLTAAITRFEAYLRLWLHSKAPNCGDSAQGREVHRSVEWDDQMSELLEEEENRTWGIGWLDNLYIYAVYIFVYI